MIIPLKRVTTNKGFKFGTVDSQVLWNTGESRFPSASVAEELHDRLGGVGF